MIDKDPKKDLPSDTEVEMATIDRLIAELQIIENTNPPNEYVDRAFAAIDDVIDKNEKRYKDYFTNNKILVTYHGSLQYNDPRNLDLDLVFISKDTQTLDQAEPIIEELTQHFEHIEDWPEMGNNEGHCDTNINNFSMEEITTEVTELIASNRAVDTEKDFLDLYIGCLLNSGLLFPEQEELFEEFRIEAKKLLLKSATLRKAVIENLQDVLKTRQERKRNKNT